MTSEEKAQWENVGVFLGAIGVIAISIGVGILKGLAMGVTIFGCSLLIIAFAMIVTPK